MPEKAADQNVGRMCVQGGHKSPGALDTAFEDAAAGGGSPALRHRLTGEVNDGLTSGEFVRSGSGSKGNGADGVPVIFQELRGAAADKSGGSRDGYVHGRGRRWAADGRSNSIGFLPV